MPTPNLAKPKLILSVKEARKLMGKSADSLSNEELSKLINDYELLARHAIRDYLVRN